MDGLLVGDIGLNFAIHVLRYSPFSHLNTRVSVWLRKQLSSRDGTSGHESYYFFDLLCAVRRLILPTMSCIPNRSAKILPVKLASVSILPQYGQREIPVPIGVVEIHVIDPACIAREIGY